MPAASWTKVADLPLYQCSKLNPEIEMTVSWGWHSLMAFQYWHCCLRVSSWRTSHRLVRNNNKHTRASSEKVKRFKGSRNANRLITYRYDYHSFWGQIRALSDIHWAQAKGCFPVRIIEWLSYTNRLLEPTDKLRPLLQQWWPWWNVT